MQAPFVMIQMQFGLKGSILLLKYKSLFDGSKIKIGRLLQSSAIPISKECQVLGRRILSKIFVVICFTPFDRFLATDHEYLHFSLSKNFSLVEKYEIFQRYRFSRKMHPFAKCAKFSILFCFFPYENDFIRFSIRN